MKILITGGTGLIGNALSKQLIAEGHSLAVLTRHPEKYQSTNIHYIGNFAEINDEDAIDAVINLAGEPIADKRWTADRKKQLEDSRIALTAQLISTLSRLKTKPTVLISGSAIGYYGNGEDNTLTEHSNATDEFSHRLCAAWEMQALRAKALGIRVCIVRTGIVLAQNGGMLKKLSLPFKLGLGAFLGSGNQWMSWIHLDDVVNCILFLLKNDGLKGIFNATTPQPVTNRDFTRAYAKSLRRPALFTFSESLLTLMFGEMAHILVTGQRVIPQQLQEAGFKFQYPELEPALNEISGRKNKDYT